MRVRELAALLGATFVGDGEKEITGAAPVDSAGSGDLAFVSGRKAEEQARHSAAGCLIVPAAFPGSAGRTVIRVSEPRVSFARALAALTPAPEPVPGVHATAVVHASAELGEGCEVGPNAVIDACSRIGRGSVIGANCVIGRNVVLGENCRLFPNVTIYDDAEIGDRTILHSGCVIAADGFGFVLVEGRYEKFPQVGRAVIGSDVEIGANSCVDRAALGVTSIGDGTKIDNMVHVGHNCRIGRHVVVAAQTGFSGGVVVEDRAVVGGQVGIGDKARIESGAVLGSGSGVLSSKIVHGGGVYWGTPARPLKQYLEQLANLSRVPELRRQLAEVLARVESLESRR
jgi:UDP-3-O-[3-hydroxymyristoyl] glucosamine N-acyltransferase